MIKLTTLGRIILGALLIFVIIIGAYYASLNQRINTTACVTFMPNGGIVVNYKENAGQDCESLNFTNTNMAFKKFKLKIKPAEHVLTLDVTE